MIAGNCLHLLPARGLKDSKEAGGYARNNFPDFWVDVGGSASASGQGPTGVSEAQGFDLRRSREPWACSRRCALSRSQPPGGCLRRNPGPSGALCRQSVHVGDWPEAVTCNRAILGDPGGTRAERETLGKVCCSREPSGLKMRARWREKPAFTIREQRERRDTNRHSDGVRVKLVLLAPPRF